MKQVQSGTCLHCVSLCDKWGKLQEANTAPSPYLSYTRCASVTWYPTKGITLKHSHAYLL